MNCYVQALPFFRFTFAGDAAFAVVFFGAYAAYRVWAEQRAVALATALRCKYWWVKVAGRRSLDHPEYANRDLMIACERTVRDGCSRA